MFEDYEAIIVGGRFGDFWGKLLCFQGNKNNRP